MQGTYGLIFNENFDRCDYARNVYLTLIKKTMLNFLMIIIIQIPATTYDTDAPNTTYLLVFDT